MYRIGVRIKYVDNITCEWLCAVNVLLCHSAGWVGGVIANSNKDSNPFWHGWQFISVSNRKKSPSRSFLLTHVIIIFFIGVVVVATSSSSLLSSLLSLFLFSFFLFLYYPFCNYLILIWREERLILWEHLYVYWICQNVHWNIHILTVVSVRWMPSLFME